MNLRDYLFDTPPIMFTRELALSVGLNKAIVLQQLQTLTEEEGEVKNGHKWVCKSYHEWQEVFPFWSVRTLQNIFTDLEQQGLVISGQLSKTKWYRVDREEVNKL